MDKNKKRKYKLKKEKNQANSIEPRSPGLISRTHNPLHSKLELN